MLSVSTRSDGAQRLTIDGLDDLEADAADAANAAYVDDTPVVLVATPLLLVAGVLGTVGAFLDLRGEAEQQALVSKLAAAAAMAYIVLLFGGIAAYVPLHPDMCTVYWRRVVPLTPQTAHLGEVVSFYPRGKTGNHLYAVLVKARFVDIFTESCMVLSLGMPLIALLILTHVAYWWRTSRHVRAITRTNRIVDRVLGQMDVTTYGQMQAAPPSPPPPPHPRPQPPSSPQPSAQSSGDGSTEAAAADAKVPRSIRL